MPTLCARLEPCPSFTSEPIEEKVVYGKTATESATVSKTRTAGSKISAASPPVFEKLAANFLSAATLAYLVAFWL